MKQILGKLMCGLCMVLLHHGSMSNRNVETEEQNAKVLRSTPLHLMFMFIARSRTINIHEKCTAALWATVSPHVNAINDSPAVKNDEPGGSAFANVHGCKQLDPVKHHNLPRLALNAPCSRW